jgi:hypothetical protein
LFESIRTIGEDATVEGLALDGEKLAAIVGRFHGTSRFLIITVYDVNKYH